MPRGTTPLPLHSGQARPSCASIALRMKALLFGSLSSSSASSFSTLKATTAVFWGLALGVFFGMSPLFGSARGCGEEEPAAGLAAPQHPYRIPAGLRVYKASLPRYHSTGCVRGIWEASSSPLPLGGAVWGEGRI